MAIEDIEIRGRAHGVHSEIVDGNDVEAVHEAADAAVTRARSGGGPTLLECKTMRMLGHAIHDGAEYVPAELLSEWEKRDPIDRFESVLLEDGVVTQEDLDEIARTCRDQVMAGWSLQISSTSPTSFSSSRKRPLSTSSITFLVIVL